MRKAVVLFALVALAGGGALLALAQASAGDSTTIPTVSTGQTSSVSSSVVVHNSSSCSVSVTSVNGVTTTTKSAGCDQTSSSCSVSVSSVNGVTTTTKTGDCADTTVTTSTSVLDADLLRRLLDDIFVWFRFAAGM